MWFRINIVLFLICTISPIFAQTGIPLITNYKESEQLENSNWAVCQDDQNEMLFANPRGLLSFDGQSWKIINMPLIPFSIAKSPFDNLVYLSGNTSFGYLSRDRKGFYQFESFCENTDDTTAITNIYFTDSSIYFYGPEAIYLFNSDDHSKLHEWRSDPDKPFTGMVLTKQNVFINVFQEGLYRIESDTLFPIVSNFYLKDKEVIFSFPYNDEQILIGTDVGKMYLFDGIIFRDYEIIENAYLNEKFLSGGLNISDSLCAFSTLEGGAVIVNKSKRNILYYLNYPNGLPDDEIYAMGMDNANGLWLSHAYGLSRVELGLPIYNYSNYPGLEGNLTSTQWHNGELFIATSEGVYFFTKQELYKESELVIRVKTKEVQTEEVINEPENKGNLFSRLFKKKSSETNQEVMKEESQQIPENQEPTFYKKKVKTLSGVDFLFKKAEGLNEKCKQLLSNGENLFALTNTGVYLIEKGKAKLILDHRGINHISSDSHRKKIFVVGNTSLFYLKQKGESWIKEDEFIKLNQVFYSSIFPDERSLWLGGDNVAYRIHLDSIGKVLDMKIFETDSDFMEMYRLQFVNDTILLFLESNIYYFNEESESFQIYGDDKKFTQSSFKYILSQNNNPWIKTNNLWNALKLEKDWTNTQEALLSLVDDIVSIYAESNNLWVITRKNQLFKIESKNEFLADLSLELYLKSITNETGVFFDLEKIEFQSQHNAISFNIVAPNYLKSNGIQYQYYIDGLMNNWSAWSTNSNINIIVKSGSYTIRIRAKDLLGNLSNEKIINFRIKPKFTETTLFYLLIGIVLILIVYVVMVLRSRKLLHDKKVLEEKVQLRTIEIREQKEEIEAQRDEITDSIEYASLIQKSMLPVTDSLSRAFKEHFILYKPRDIVSGDFYWFTENKDHLYFTVADCTGHGVPGALMSMLGSSALNDIVSNNKNLKANEILNRLRNKIKIALNQTGKEGESKDGMDMAFCILHKDKKILEFSGAYNPLYLIRKGKLIEYKSDRMPIGIYYSEKDSFTNIEIELKKGDSIYIMTDGYADQFGGENDTKFKSQNVKVLLSEIAHKSMKEQLQVLEENFNKWKGNAPQVDDILIIGLRV